MLTIDRHPTPSQLRNFGKLLAIFVPVFGALVWWRTGRLASGGVVWIVGGLLTTLYALLPSIRWATYVGWMYAVFPIGWTVSHILMAVIYYLAITPIGMVLRFGGRDLLLRRLDRAEPSYWLPHVPPGDSGRYFRQY
jgi:Saxitoxin biosynthesis operon protein SxtJ